ncbi:MAG: putative toxin-antitoxin system toxin component, PIN family [Anaerolineae bacterium]|nr:putative toxin-antitoxin system toxin component, PIN family [Anaerolineae bacterium]
MRAILDANILIAYLLTPEQDSAISRIVRAAFLGEFRLLLPEELLEELARKARAKEYLLRRIAPEDLIELAAIVSQVAETIPRITDAIPAVTRDPKDDYLLAYAVVGQADYLVTGDRDLLTLERVGATSIVTALEFWEVLNGARPSRPEGRTA